MAFDLTRLSNARSFALSPENPDGSISGGSRGTHLVPDPAHGTAETAA